MTRTPKEAAEGRLGLILGGSDAAVARLRPVFKSFGETIVHAGGPGAGHALKLLHNFVSLGFSAVLAEAAVTAEARGIPMPALVDVLEGGAGRGAILDRFRPWLLDGDPSGMAFGMANAAKDLGYHAGTEGTGPLAEVIAALFAEAAARAPDDAVPALTELLRSGGP